MVLEVLRKESEKQRREGKREGISLIAKRMLAKNMKITDIKEITGLSAKEIEKLKV